MKGIGEYMIRRVRHFGVLGVLLFFVMLCCTPVRADSSNDVIKVGFPYQEGLTMKDEYGNYTGYTYDYLKEIAQYTGWEYEIVEAEGTLDEQLSAMLELLESGEIDLLGAMSSNEETEKMFDFPSENYGNAYSVIAVSKSEANIDEYNLSEHKDFHVALMKQAKTRNELFFQYAKLNGIAYETIWCDTEEEQLQAVSSGEADALLTVNLAMPESVRPIIKFSPVPFYFATTKGNTRIVSELNQAITYISEVHPNLQSDLYNKYFNKQEGEIYLNSREKEYVEEHNNLKVLVHDGFGPMQYYDENKKIKGVGYDILNNIAEAVGWNLEYVYTDTYDEYEKILLNQEADVLLSIDYDYDTALKKNLLLSNPYLETEKVMVAGEGVDVGKLSKEKRAVYKGERIPDEKIENAIYYDTVEESLQAVERGECGYTYCSSYAASYYQHKDSQSHTIIYPQMADDTIRYSLGIIDKEEKQLAVILNKGIRAIETSELEGYIYHNAQQEQKVNFAIFIKENPYVPAVFILIVAVLAVGIIFISYRNKLKMNKIIELENVRYRYLSDMLKEVTFTYDYQEDKLVISKEGMRIFQTPEVIEHYSAYPKTVVSDERHQSLYAIIAEKKDVDVELKLKLPGADAQWYHVVIKVVFDDKEAVSAIGRFQNVHSEKVEKEELLEKSRLDGLTGICNAATLKKEIAHLLQDKSQEYALAILDLDGFKGVNDTYGHYTGDRVLIETANAMKEVFKENSVLGRLGGDEFAICVKLETRNRLKEQIEMLFQELRYRGNLTNTPIPTISVGVAFGMENDDFKSLYQRADLKLYAVKNSGKNSYDMET